MPDPLLARLAERLRALDPHGGSVRRQGAGKEPPPAVDRR
jgi:hypothetical protein